MCIAWGQPIEYIEALPDSVISEFMALDTIMPFTPTAGAYRDGLMCALLYNQNATKKSQTVSVEELFPYLKHGTPEWLEDERIIKVKSVFNAIRCHTPELYKESFNDICKKIKEEIEIEQHKKEPDLYVINKLKEFLTEDRS